MLDLEGVSSCEWGGTKDVVDAEREGVEVESKPGARLGVVVCDELGKPAVDTPREGPCDEAKLPIRGVPGLKGVLKVGNGFLPPPPGPTL